MRSLRNLTSPLPGALSGTALLAAFVLLLVGVVNSVLGGSWESVSMNFLISVVAVVGLGLFSGNSGILSFGHVGFMAIGAYLSSILILDKSFKQSSLPDLPGVLADIQLPSLVGLLVTVLIVAVVAYPLGFPLVRFNGIAAAIATFALLIVVNSVLIGADSITRGSQTFYGVPPFTTWELAIPLAIGAMFIARWFRDSDMGLQLRASRENEDAARSAGIDVARTRLIAWCLSAGMMAAAGALYAGFITAFSPKSFYLDLTFTYIVMMLFGGWTTVSGVVLGAAGITAITQLLQEIQNEGYVEGFFGLPQIGLSVAILAVLYIRPSGVMGYIEADTQLARFLRRRFRGPAAEADGDGDAEGVPTGKDLAALAAIVVPPASEAAGRDTRLTGRGITKRFVGLTALDGVDVELERGEILGLIGPNGSGKTTLLNVLTGVLEPTEGEVQVGGTPTAGLPTHRVARLGVARTFQNIRLFKNLSVRENIVVGLSTAPDVEDRDAAITAALAMMDLEHEAELPAGTLSYGDQRRLEIARALAARPDFVLLDEPAAGMNHVESDELLGVLVALRRDTGVGVLIVDHDLRLMMRLCDRIIVLNQGHLIADGTPGDIEGDAAVREAYLGAPESSVEAIQ